MHYACAASAAYRDAMTHAAGSDAAPRRTDAEATGPAAHRSRLVGILLMLTSSASNQAGAAIGAGAFPAIGPIGVVAVRQLVAALVLTPLVRPRLRGLRRGQWAPILGMAAVFSVMNLSLYMSIDRIGLAPAATLEFLGPLTVAIAGSRRLVDFACALLAGAGVVVLTDPGPSSDLVGIGLGLLAAGGWAVYILLNRTLGRRLPGLRGTAIAALVTGVAWAPVAGLWFASHTPTAASLAMAAVCGLMSSAVPYAADLLTLRRVPAHLFGTFTSVNPVWAALAGWAVLHEALHANEWIGMGLIVLGNVLVSLPRTADHGMLLTRRPRAAHGRPPGAATTER